MLKPQLLNTYNTFLPDTSNNGNVGANEGFLLQALNVVQIVNIRHRLFRFLGTALSFKSGIPFFGCPKMYLFLL